MENNKYNNYYTIRILFLNDKPYVCTVKVKHRAL